MAKLQELRPMIDAGKEVILILPHDHPGNKEEKNLKIFISQDRNGLYRRKSSYIDENLWNSPISSTYTSWEELLQDISEEEITSSQWAYLT